MNDDSRRESAERMVEAFLAGEAAPAVDRERARGDRELAELEADLLVLARELDGVETAEPSATLLTQTVRAGRSELAAAHRPGDLVREWARLLGASAAALPLVIAWNAAVLFLLPPLLAKLLPEALAAALPVLYVFGAAGWLALLYVSLPALAHKSLTRRQREALG